MLLAACWVASALVFSAFFTKSIVRLRIIAIASNLAFMSYALLGLEYGDFSRLYPIFVLHTALLPLNVSRLNQLRKNKHATTSPANGEKANRAGARDQTRTSVTAGEVNVG
jgi:CRP/FNR family transcriptional regulator, cyclic AMP receptor protein